MRLRQPSRLPSVYVDAGYIASRPFRARSAILQPAYALSVKGEALLHPGDAQEEFRTFGT